MNIRLLAASALALILAACGGDDRRDESVEASGVLQTAAKGVRYTTATRSGETDSAGTFKYLPGETVTFSIGGIQLGAASGASRITLFTLAGMTPPTTELALRRELLRLLPNRTPLARAVNLSRLLLALDADGDPRNGIDVTAQAAALASTQLTVEYSTSEFAGRIHNLVPGMNNNLPFERPIVFLFETLGVPIAGLVPVRTTYDFDNDGTVEISVSGTYDSAGYLETTLVETDPIFFGAQNVAYTHDAMGRESSRRTESDVNVDGTIDVAQIVKTSFDTHGNALSGSDELDGANDGSINSRSTFVSTLDNYGRAQTTVYSIDSNGDGVTDDVETHVFTYESHGFQSREDIAIDFGVDGQVDARYYVSFEYDAGGFQTGYRFERDSDADGHIDSFESSEQTLDGHHRAVVSISSSETDGDGIVDSEIRQHNSYDAAGNLVRNQVEFVTAGVVDFRYDTSYTYDQERRGLTGVRLSDFNSDGVFESRETTTNVFDTNGLQLRRDATIDNLLDGVTDSSSHTLLTYDSQGAQLTALDSIDFDADGTNDAEQIQTNEYEFSTDAAARIIRQYFPY